MISKLVYCSIFIVLGLFSNAQGPDQMAESNAENEIKEMILSMFDGMRQGDSSMVSNCFLKKDLIMNTSYVNKAGKIKFKGGSLEGFLKSVGTPHPEIWDERLAEYEIKVDANLASVWTKYYFYVDENFSHCGVNFFLCTNTDEGWKIFSLADTRQLKDCNPPVKEDTW